MTDDLLKQAQVIAARIEGLNSQSVQKPTFVYLDLIGIGWPIRALLHLKQVDYELISIPMMVWLQRDASGKQLLHGVTKNGHVPLYVDREVELNQSIPIMEYLAEKHDMLGDTPAERWAIKEVMAHAYDSLFSWGGMLPVIAKVNLPDDLVNTRLNAFLGDGESWGMVTGCYERNLLAFEKYLEANAHNEGGYMVGSRLSIADLHAFNVLCNWYKAFDPERFKTKHPGLNAFVLRLGAIPEVRDYITNHQEATTWLPIPPVGLRLTTPDSLVGLID